MQIAAPHVRLAILGEDLVAFDLRQDRYIAIPGAVVEDGPPSSCTDAARWLDPAAAAMLSDAGLLVDGVSEALSLSRPVAALRRSNQSKVRARHLAYLVIALVRAGWRLAHGRHCLSFDSNSLPAITPAEAHVYARAIDSLAALRILIPTPRRCLPAALIAGIFLKMQGLEADFVFGVRSHPFEAHCWLQRGPLVIDDDLDRVSAYTPIAMGRL